MRIREAGLEDVAAIARVHVDSSRTAYRGIIPEHYLQAFSYAVQEEFFADLLRKPDIFCYLAEMQKFGVVGFAAGCPERTGHPIYKGELYALYVVQEHHRQGIGKRLVQWVAERFYRAGVDAMRVWVLAKNPAVYFYRSLAAKQMESQLIEIGGSQLEEVCLGWRDTRLLTVSFSPLPDPVHLFSAEK